MGNGILKYLLFALAGYVSGSIMYSYLIPKLFCGVDIVKEGEDHNPGMTNVMRCVSVKLGVLLLLQAMYQTAPDEIDVLRRAAQIKLMPYRCRLGV